MGMVPVVVINSSLNALGVVRSLASGGMPIYMATDTWRSPAAWSRFCRVVRLRGLSGRTLIDGLKRLGEQIGQRPVLILTGDGEVDAVSAHRAELEPLFRVSLPEAQMVSVLADKTLFQNYAEQAGFPVPRSVVISADADLDLIEGLSFPVVIKPGDKTLVLSGCVERAVRASTPARARSEAVRMLAQAKRLVVQEWIDGPDSEIYFTLFACDRSGDVIAIFSGRKLVCDPPAIGNTAVCVAASQAAATTLEGLCKRFITHVGYRGLGSLEFKFSRRDNRFVIIEPTVGRTDWQEEIATLCGVNIPLAAYWAELGQQPPPEAQAEPREAAWRASVEHRMPLGMLPVGARTFDGYFRLSDPLPGLYYYGVERFPDYARRRTMQLMRLPARAMAAAAQYFL
jgi:predicted ATP-grasp superfamily ATP-dependent carboligase